MLKGFDSELNRPVAIKLLAPHLARVGAARQRFAREARAAAAVVHDHVVSIHNVESNHATPFLVMQFIPGESLQGRVEREGPLSVAEILRIGLQAAAGLAAAHAQGLVHRDVKPANILLENGVERAYLTDFGLARASDDASLTYTGVVAGTPHYMSPEQADGQPLDYRSDLFSLGSVLYFMATGHPPFRADRPMAVLKRTCHDRHRPAWQCNPEIPDALSAIIDRLLEKDPARRFTSAADLQLALARVLADVQQRNPGERHQRTRARLSRWQVGGKIAVVVLVSGMAVWFVNDNRHAEAPRTSSATDEHSQRETAGFTKSAAELNHPLPLPPEVYPLSVDPSPAIHSQNELNSLSHLLDTLEATPFPDFSPSGDSKTAATTSDRSESPPTTTVGDAKDPNDSTQSK